MCPKRNLGSFTVNLICLLYVLLFVYTATSKLIDFETFSVQIGQSPLLSAFADWVAFSIPPLEIFIALLLVVPRYRFTGLFMAFALMTMFTAYIIIILNYSAFIPCSCGGILSDMDWTTHLIFNLIFIILALASLVIHYNLYHNIPSNSFDLWQPVISISKKAFIIRTILLFLFSIIFIVVLYLLSEEAIHRNNGFVRRYPHHPVNKTAVLPLEFNSYYIAGFANGRIYLGNVSAPLNMLSIDTLLKDIKPVRITLKTDKEYPFTSVHVRIKHPNFFLFDGTVPVIFNGSIDTWNASPFETEAAYFSHAEAIDSTQFIFRGVASSTNETVLGKFTFSPKLHVELAPQLLQRKIDGLFDSDGLLSYNESLDKLVYVYYYRNEFLVTGTNFKNTYRGTTIDTMTQSAIKIAYLEKKQQHKLASKPEKINKYGTSAGRYLFVTSDRLGRYEPEVMLEDASIVDVYDLKKHTYEFSFYLYKYKNEKVISYQIYGNTLFGLTEHYLVAYKLEPLNFNLMYR